MDRRKLAVIVAVIVMVMTAMIPGVDAWDKKPSSPGLASEEPAPAAKDPSPSKPGSKSDATLAEKPQKPSSPDETVEPQKPAKPVEKDPVVGVDNFDDILVLVNKTHTVSADKVPGDLTSPNVQFSLEAWNKLLRSEAALALEEMFKQAASEDINLLAVSGYRSYQTQAAIFAYQASQVGETQANRTSARAGQSEHQTGLAIDITCPSVDQKLSQHFGSTPEGKWVAEHAAEYGFIIRYPKGKESITGYSFEPWHLRYVGIEAAQAISSQGLTLEEYLD